MRPILEKAIRIQAEDQGSPGQGSCTLEENDFWDEPSYETTYVSYYDFMIKSNPVWWVQSSIWGSTDNPEGNIANKGSEGSYLTSENNVGGLRSRQRNQFPWSTYMSNAQSNNDWVEATKSQFIGTMPGNFTIFFVMNPGYNTARNNYGRIVGCWEGNNAGEKEWMLYYDNNGRIRLRYYLVAGGSDRISPVMTNNDIFTTYGLTYNFVVVTRDESDNVGGLRCRIWDSTGTLVEDNSVTNELGAKVQNQVKFKFKWRPATVPTGETWDTTSRLDVYNYAHWHRILSDNEIRNLREMFFHGRPETQPWDITDFDTFMKFRAALQNYYDFRTGTGSDVPDFSRHHDDMVLTGASNLSSNQWSTPIPAKYGGGTGQKISSGTKFTERDPGITGEGPMSFFITAGRRPFLTFLIAGVQSSNGNQRNIIVKNDGTDIGNYLNVVLTADNRLEVSWRVYYTPNSWNYEHKFTLAQLGSYGSQLFETDDWQLITLHFSTWHGYIYFDGGFLSGTHTAYPEVEPYGWRNIRYGYDDPPMDVPTVIGGGISNVPYQETFNTLLVVDNFTDTNGTLLTAHTPDTDNVGNGWTNTGNGFTIQGNQMQATASNDQCWIDTGNAEQMVQWEHNPGGADNRHSALLNSDGSDTLTCYYFNVRTDEIAGATSGTLWIYRYDAGVATTFASSIPMAMTNTATNTFRAVAKNGELRFYCNNVRYYLGTDPGTALTGTYIGLRQNQFINNAARWDNLQVGTITEAPTSDAWSMGIGGVWLHSRVSYFSTTNPVDGISRTTFTGTGDGWGRDYRNYLKSSIDGNGFRDYPSSYRDALSVLQPKNRFQLWSNTTNLAVDSGTEDLDLATSNSSTFYFWDLEGPYNSFSPEEGLLFKPGVSGQEFLRDQSTPYGHRINTPSFQLSITFSFNNITNDANIAGIMSGGTANSNFGIRTTTGGTGLDFLIYEASGTERKFGINLALAGLLANNEKNWLWYERDAVGRTFKLYINGDLYQEWDITGHSDSFQQPPDTNWPFFLGYDSRTGAGKFDGAISEYRLWDESSGLLDFCSFDAACAYWKTGLWIPPSGVIEHQVSFNPAAYIEVNWGQQFYVQQVTVNVSNGSGNFSYSWSQVSGNTDLELYGDLTSATVTIRGQSQGETQHVFRCEVTDIDNGNLVKSADILFVINWGGV